jgi:hypothetical protein
MQLEAMIEALQPGQLAVFSQHYRPGNQAEDPQANYEDLFHCPAALENFDEVGGEHRRKKDRHGHVLNRGKSWRVCTAQSMEKPGTAARNIRANLIAMNRARFFLGHGPYHVSRTHQPTPPPARSQRFDAWRDAANSTRRKPYVAFRRNVTRHPASNPPP